MEQLLSDVAEIISWLESHVRLIVGDVVVSYIHRLCDRTETFMVNLDPTSTPLTIQAVKLPRPEYFDATSGQCLCDFGGCCCHCKKGCRGCGNNACCVLNSCGHECCNRYDSRLGGFGDWDHNFTDKCSCRDPIREVAETSILRL